MLECVAFLQAQDLDAETLAYLRATYEEGGAEDLCEVADAFLAPGALAELRTLADAAAATAPPPRGPPAVGAFLADLAEACGAMEAAPAEEAPGAAAAAKPSKAERRKARVKAKERPAAKAAAKGTGSAAGAAPAGGARGLHDVAAFGLAETEEGLDAFDSFAVCWGKAGRRVVQRAEAAQDINLPLVYLGIVTELGQKDLIEGSPLQIMRGHRYGLIGANGCGKTTLLRRLARRQLPGLPSLRYGYVAQELVGTEDSVLEVVCTADTEYQGLLRVRGQVEQALAAADVDDAEKAQLTEDFASVIQRIDEVEEFYGQDGLKGHAREVLLGLQFSADMLDMPTRALSGGWRMRLALAQALLSRADCLLLDEPTNHLDLAGVLWLEHFLKTKLDPECMLVMISHDRAFLDAVVTDIVSIRGRRIEQGPGNLSSWQQRRAEEKEAIVSKLDANERERERTKEMIQKMREAASSGKRGKEGDANKLRQAKQREEWLYGKVSSSGEEKTYGRLEMVNFHGKFVDIKALAADALAEEAKVTIKLPEPELLRGNLLQLDGASFAIAEVGRTILSNVTLSLAPESRVAVVGTNGAGKTTLLRWLEGQQWPNKKAHRHPKLKVAHVSQHHLEQLEDSLGLTALAYLRGVLPALDPGQDPNTTLSRVAKDEFLFGYLANFGLGGIAKQKVGTLSGGQKARLAFAAAVWHRPHLLLLDEPTNHLDIETLDALAAALQAFQGAAVIVSHNRSFLAEVCNELWVVEGGGVRGTVRGGDCFGKEFGAFQRRMLRAIRGGA